MQLTEYLKDIADAIRENTGTTEPIAAQNFKDEITKFSELDAGVYAFSVGSGGTGVNDATVNTLPGNLVLAFVCVTTDVTYPDLEGWTKIEPSIISNTNRITDEQMDIWYKITESETESIHVSTSASTNLATALMSFKNMQIVPILDQVKGGHSATFTDIKKGDLICCVNPWYSMGSYMKEPYSINIKCNKYLGWYKYYFTIFEALEDVASATVSGGNSSYNGYGVLQMNRPTLSNSLKAGVTHGKTVGTFTSDATITADQMMIGQTAYVNGEKITGTMANLGTLSYQPSDEEYIVPAGYTDGITIAAADITDLEEYQACLALANSIDTEVDTSDATAKAEDIAEGKIAYSCGERLVGTMEEYQLMIDTSGSVHNKLNQTLKDILIKAKGLNFINSSEAEAFRFFSRLEEVSFKAMATNHTSYYNMFQECKALKKIEGFSAPAGRTFQYMFQGCTSLEEAPAFDTPKAVDFSFMFSGCTSLREIPYYSNAGSALMTYGVKNMISGCPNLSDKSLNNVMAMCRSWYNSEQKTLAFVGFSPEQVERCKTLSVYEALINAGWTTGY